MTAHSRPRTSVHDLSSTAGGQVRCHSGYAYAQRPTAILWEDEWLSVAQIEDEWKTPDGKLFRVLTEGDQVFELLYNPADDKWHIKNL